MAIELPNFPLTGIFVKKESAEQYPNFDQSLMACTCCGHVQLLNAVDPIYLYKDTYTHRTSPSPIASAGNDFFHTFLRKICGQRTFDTILEVGCNDHYLLKKLEDIGRNRIGIDPILAGQEDKSPPGIKSIGKFVEDVDWAGECGRPDLVLSVHTFEHVCEPRKIFEPLFECAADGALFIIEVPGFDSLLNVNRFDQVFHQHVNYYSLASFVYLIEQLGGRYVGHTFNFRYWNGTMLIAFEKRKSDSAPDFLKPSKSAIHAGFARFKSSLQQTKGQLDYLRAQGVPLFGFGAAQMLPCLAYHLETDMNEFECILDDNQEKNGMSYPHLAVEIRTSSGTTAVSDSAVLITALDSARKAIPRLIADQARYIIQPLPVF